MTKENNDMPLRTYFDSFEELVEFANSTPSVNKIRDISYFEPSMQSWTLEHEI
jgi:hypothetical protein